MSGPIRFAIVGCGSVAHVHIKALSEIPDAKVTALIGRTLDAPTRLAKELQLCDVSVHADLGDAIASTEFDAVIVCTPSGAHLDAAIQAAQAGKHVVVEKPLEITPARCDQIIEACDSAGVQLSTIFPARFSDTNIALKAAVDSGRFGRLTLGEASCKWWRTQQYYDSGEWRGTWSLDGGGALMNQAIHAVDLLLWLMGPASEVSAITATLAHANIEVEDTAVATIRFANGAIGTITAATSAYPGSARHIAIHGDRGSAVVAENALLTWQFADERLGDESFRQQFAILKSKGGAAEATAISHEGHTRQIRNVMESIRTGSRPAIDGHEGRKAVELICAIYEAARTGKRIPLGANHDRN